MLTFSFHLFPSTSFSFSFYPLIDILFIFLTFFLLPCITYCHSCWYLYHSSLSSIRYKVSSSLFLSYLILPSFPHNLPSVPFIPLSLSTPAFKSPSYTLLTFHSISSIRLLFLTRKYVVLSSEVFQLIFTFSQCFTP